MPRKKESLNELLAPGNKLKIYIGENNPNNKTVHIRAIVDESIVVYRVWRKSWQGWDYWCRASSYFEGLYKEGYLKRG